MTTKINLKNFVRWMLISSSLVIIALVLFFRFSPYDNENGNKKKLIKTSIIINKPVDTVYYFMSKNKPCEKGLLYLDHIDVLNNPKKANSEVGTKKRFYTNADETGQQFDGIVINSIKNKKRRLELFNFQNFPMEFNNLIHEQTFSKIGKNKCKLNMKLFYKKNTPEFWDEVKAHIASYRIKKAFKENMLVIKTQLEEI